MSQAERTRHGSGAGTKAGTLAALLLATSIYACQSTTNVAIPPIADAGVGRIAILGTEVTLDGTASHTYDGRTGPDVLTFAWSFVAVPPGSSASLFDPTAPSPTFVVDALGDFIVRLVVSEGAVSSRPAVVVIRGYAPLAIERQIPPDGAFEVQPNVDVAVVFAEPVQPESVTPETFFLLDGRTQLPGLVHLEEGNTVAVFVPSEPYPRDRRITVVVTQRVVSLRGLSLPVAYHGRFYTAAGPDVLPPSVLLVEPGDGTTGVPPWTSVAVTFDEPVDVALAQADTNGDGCPDLVQLRAENGGCVTGTIEAYAGGTRLLFTPAVPLTAGAVYTVEIMGGPAGLADRSGNHLAADVTSSFVVATGPDNTPPSVVSIYPGDGYEGVPLGAEITVTFSEPVDPSSLTSASFSIVDSRGQAVTGSFAGSLGHRVVTMSPTALEVDTLYTVTLRGDGNAAITDLAGLRLDGNGDSTAGGDFVASFRTSATRSYDGTFTLPPTVTPGTLLTVELHDRDLDTSASADQAEVAVACSNGDLQSTLVLTETGGNTGVFAGTISTVYGTLPLAEDDILTIQAGDILTFNYEDAVAENGTPQHVEATVDVVGGVDGVLEVDPQQAPGQQLTLSVTDSDRDTSPNAIDRITVTVTSSRAEVESVSLSETGLATGVFHGTLATALGSGGTNGDGRLDVQSGDSAITAYVDTLTALGSQRTVSATTNFLGGQVLQVSVTPESATEGAGSLVAQGVLRIPGALGSPLTVNLTSDDVSELTLPATVVIPAGSTAEMFDLFVVDDTEIDGSKTVTVTASAPGWTAATDTIAILDNETQSLSVVIAPASAAESDGVLVAQGAVGIPGTFATDVTVSLTSSNTAELTVPATVVITAGSTIAMFDLTMVDDAAVDGQKTVTVTAAATGWTSGNDQILVTDDESPTLHVTVPATARETDGTLVGQGVVSIPGTLPTDLGVFITSSDTTEARVPVAVIIPTGTTSAIFDLTIMDDSVIDGDQSVTIRAFASGWNDGLGALTVTDSETRNLTVTITPASASETDGTLTAVARVAIDGTFATDLVISLTSDDPSELTTPASVTIIAGQTSALFDLTVVDDSAIDGTQTATVSASATGWTAGSDTIDVIDNETQAISVRIIPASATEADGTLPGAAQATIPGTFASDVVVTLASSDATELTAPATVTIVAGTTSVTFDIAVVDDPQIDGTQTVTLTGSLSGWTSGSDTIDVLDDEPRTITLSITPPSALESAGVLTGQGSVSIAGTMATALTVTLASSDTTEITVPASVTITAGATSATFNMTVVNDTAVDGTQTATVTGSVSGWTSGSDTIDILDDETQALTLTITPLSATEGAGTVTGQATVAIPGTLAADLVVTLASSDTTELTTPASATITAGTTSASFALTIVDDTQIDGPQTVTVTASATGWTPATDTIDILDNETQSLTIAITPATATEGNGALSGQGRVSIPGILATDLTVTLASNDSTELTVPASVTITAGTTSVTFDLTVVDDTQIDGAQTVTVTSSASGWNPSNDTIDILDNETRVITLTLTPASATEGNGTLTGQGTASITGTLATNLTVTLASSDTTELTVPASVTIPAGSTSVPFDLTVINDTIIDGTQTVTVTASATGGWTSGTDTIDVLDDESKTLTVTVPVSASEGAGVLTGQGRVSIPGTFASDVGVLLSSSDTTEVTVPAATVILAGSTSATFDVTIINDSLIDGTQTVTITASASGWTSGTDTIDVLDNESQALTVVITPVSVNENAGTVSGQAVVSIPGSIGTDLVVSLASSDITELTVPATVTITAGTTSAAFAFTAVDDTQIDGAQSVTVTASASGWTSGTDTISVADNESQTITLAVVPASATEGAGTLSGQGTVSIPGTLAANLVITLSSSDTTELTLPATVTIPAGSTSATFDLTVVDDAQIDGAQNVTVTGAATGWTSGTDSISIADNESQTITVTIVPASASETAGVISGQATVTIPGTYATNLVVTLTSSDTTELTVPASVTITAGATSASFNLTVVDDAQIDGTQTVTVTGAASGWTSGTDTIAIQDNESQSLTLTITPASATEGAGTLVGQGTVSIPGTLGSDLAVTLTTSDGTEVTVPGAITILAGTTSRTFDLTIVNDTEIDGTQTVTITASATGWNNGSDTIDVLDNETRTLTLAVTPANATEGTGTLAGQGTISIPGTFATDLVVTLGSNDASELTVPASATILAGTTSVTFNLTVIDDTQIDGAQTVTVTASASGWTSGSDTIDILDNESQTITLTITPASATEGVGTLTGQGVVSIPGTLAVNLVVTLGSNDTTELTVPASVTITAGSTSALFDITVVNDTQVDGTQTVTVTGSASGWTSGSDTIDILDNETQTITIAITPLSATEGAGTLTGQGTALIPGTLPSNLVISLTSSDTTELSVPATVTIPAGSMAATFDITVVDDSQIDGAQSVSVTGAATGWTSGADSISILDNESQTLTVTVPVSATEGGGVLTGQGTVTIPGTWPSDLGVSLFSSDTSEITVPVAVVIAAGTLSATFDLTVIDDTLIDGAQTVTITASVTGWTSGTDTIAVNDNETQTLTLVLVPASATEGDGTLTGQGSVSIPGTLGSNLVVTLGSSDTTELTVPASVTITAGSTSATFNLTVVNDTQIDGPQSVTVTGSATGWTSGSDAISILDNETQTIALSVTPLSAAEGAGTLTGQGSVSIPGTLGTNLVVTLTSNDTTELTVPASVTIPAGSTSATFDLTVVNDTQIDGAQTVTVTGSATGWTSGTDTITITDNETQTIALAITPASAAEGVGTLTGQGSVSIPGTYASDLVVTLTSNDTTELTVPASVTIPAGSTSATFDLTVVNDTQIDGAQTVTVTGSATGWTSGTDTISITDNETQTITVTMTPLTATEGAGTLSGQASVSIPGTYGSDLVVTLSSSDTTELTVPASVTIAAGASSAPFTLTVVDDVQIDGPQTVTVTGAVTGWTSGSDTISIQDNETQTITLVITPASTTEGAGTLTGQGTVSIPGTLASDLVVTLASNDTTELTVPASVTITTGSTSASFDLTVVNDAQIDGTQTVTVTGSATGWTSGSDTINVQDNETQTFTVTITPASAAEGAGTLTGQATVSIPGTLASDLSVTLASSDATELTVPASVTITAGTTSAPFNFTVVDDTVVDGTQTATVTASASGWTSGSDSINITDNESQTITVTITPASAAEGAGVLTGQATVSIPGTYGVALVVTLSSSDTTELTVPASVTIPAGSTSAAFDLTVVDDTQIDGSQSVTVTGSATGWTSGTDTISITDNETQTLTLTITPGSAAEGAGTLTGQGTISIPGTLGSNLVVSLSSSDTTELTVPASVTITAGTTSASFDLTVVNDTLIDGPQSVTITGSATGWTSGSDTISITDNETQTITVTITPATATEGAGTLSGQASVSIPGTYASDVVVTLTSDDITELTVPGSVTILAGSTSATFAITVVDDTQIDGTQTVSVTGSATGWTSGSDTIGIQDNESRTITVTITPAAATEGNGVITGQATVSIPGTFASDLGVTLASSDTSELTVAAAVIITAGTTSATFDLTIIDDTQIDGTQTVTVTGSATGWTSGTDTINVQDNETQTITLVITPANATEGNGTLTGQGSVSIPGTYGSALVVTLASSDTTELTVPASVTIPAGSTSALFDLTVVNDTVVDGSQSVTVTGSATGWTSGSDSINILDNESQTITLTITPASATEGAGALTNQGTVSIPGTYASNLVVTIASGDTSELTVPASVTITAGSTSATFTLTVVDDAQIDGTQTVTVTGSASGWTSGSDTIDIIDNESSTLTIVVPASASEGAGVLTGQGTVSIPGTLGTDLGVTLTSSDTSEVTVPAAVVILAGSTSATFSLTMIQDSIIDETQTVTITASATGWNNGTDTIDVLDDEPKTITVAITPASSTEGAGTLTGQGTVSIPATYGSNLTITLSSTDSTELTVPASVTITAGATSATFDLTVVDDTQIDGPQTVTVTGSATGWTSGSDTIAINDNETQTITVSIAPASATEGDGVLTGQGSVSIPGTYASNLVVTLASSDTTEVTVPASVTITAGSTSATFNVTVVDDTIIDGSQSATITASASGWTGSTDSLSILDNETQTITLTITPPSATEGAGTISGQAAVSIPGTYASDLTVTLASSDTTELTVPGSVTIAAGSTTASFAITVVNDTEIDGTRNVTVTGSASGWTSGSDSIDILDNETQTITVAITPASATEGNGTLTGQGTVSIPGTYASDLVVTLASNDTSELTVPASVTITAGTTSATFSPVVVDDTEIDGTKSVTVTGSASGWTSGSDSINIFDSESQTITLTIAPVSATEGAGTLTGQGSVSIPGTYASDLTITLASNDTTEVTVPASVTIPAGSTSALFNLSVVNDTEIDGTKTATVTGSASGWSSGSDSIDILDNETQTITLTITPATATEGAGTLSGQASVSIPGTYASNLVVTLTSSDTTELTVPASVTITAGTTSATFNLTVVDDGEIDGSKTVTVSGTASGWTSGSDTVDILDNETQTITLTITPASATEGAGTLTGQGSVSIPGTCASDLLVTLGSNDTSELTVPASVTITAGTTSVTFNLTVVDDTQIDGPQTVTVTGSASGWASGSDTISIQDNETQTITLSIAPATAAEGSGTLTAQGSVSIPGTYASNLVVTLTSNDVTELTVPASVTITAGSTSATFDLTVVDDTQIDGPQTVTVSGAATGWTGGSDTLSVTDNETQTITLTITPASATEGAGTLTGQATVSIPGTYASNLVITLVSSDTTELTVPASVTITAGATSAAFNVTVVDDAQIDGTQSLSVTGSASGWTSGSDTFNIADNESQTLTVTITPLSATEGNGTLTGQATVSIPGTYASDLTVTLSSSDTSELTVPASVTITAGATSASFNMTVVDDTEIDGPQSVTVSAAASGWTGGSDTISIADNETQTISLTITPATATEGNGVLTNQGMVSIPGTYASNLVVTLTSSDTTELTVPATVTIAAGSTSALFDLTVVDDTVIDGSIAGVMVTGSVSGWTSGSDTITIQDNETQTISVTITPTTATEGDGVITGQATVSIPGTYASNLVVTLASSDTTELTVPATVTITAGSTSAGFNLTVVDDTIIDGSIAGVTVTGSASGWTGGSDTITIQDNETRTITLAIAPTSTTEGAGTLTGQATVSIPGTFASDLVITLSSTDTTELTVPASVTILAGSTSAAFNLTVVDDGQIDGTQSVTVTGSAATWTSGSDSINVADNETQTITVNIALASASEAAGAVVGQASVSIPGTFGSDLVVTLSSNDATELTVPASVTIPAGSTSAPFTLTLVNDGAIDGPQTATVSASATGWTGGSDTLSVLDDETQTITITITPPSVTEGDGTITGQATVSIPGTWGSNLVVTLSSDDTTELTVPASVTITAGATSAAFSFTVVDDSAIDGAQTATLSASATGWTGGSDSVSILDNESQTITVAITPASATEGIGVLTNQGTVSIPGTYASNVVITLTSEDTTELTVPESVTIVAGSTSALFSLTVVNDTEIDGTQNVIVSGAASGWTGGSDTIDILDNEAQTISVNITPATATEGNGVITGQATVSIPGTYGSNLVVTLASSDTTELTVPASVTITAGSTSAAFNLTVVDDTIIDGNIAGVTVTGSASGWTNGSDTITIQDNETRTITLAITPASTTEGAGTLSGQATVSIPGTFASDLVVSLSSTDTTELTVPASVTIPAGSTSAAFNLTVVDDAEIDGTGSVTVTGSAATWTSGSDSINVGDNESQTITVTITPASATEGDGTITGQATVSIPGTWGSDLVIALSSDDVTELTVPASVTITAGSTSASFDLTIVDDVDIDGTQTATVTGSVGGWTSVSDSIDVLSDE